MTTIEKKWIERVLESLDFVKWDRFYVFPKWGLTVFGWISRKDNYKDFVILEFTLSEHSNPSCVCFLGTSSVRYSKKIADILGSKHAKCFRVESVFDVHNKICIKEKKK